LLSEDGTKDKEIKREKLKKKEIKDTNRHG
jgi:hypothetical protein